MQALTLNGTIVQICVDRFPVAPSLQWNEVSDDAVVGGTIIDGVYSAPPSPAVTFEDLRRERDRLLADSDWTQTADAPVDKAAWASYRQALRDLPANTPDPSNPAWPTKPGAYPAP